MPHEVALDTGTFRPRGSRFRVASCVASCPNPVTELIDAKMDTSAQQRRKDKLQMLGAIFALGLLSIGLNCASRPASVAPVQGVAVYVGQGAADAAVKTLPGGVPFEFDLKTFLGAIASGEMGKKAPVEHYVPDRPLPHQKLPPCDSGLQESEVNGGCWMEGKAGPPCDKLFRHGDSCYRPIAADPLKPVGLVPEEARQEQHPAQP